MQSYFTQGLHIKILCTFVLGHEFYIYIHASIHVHTHVYINAHTHKNVRTFIYLYIQRSLKTFLSIHTYLWRYSKLKWTRQPDVVDSPLSEEQDQRSPEVPPNLPDIRKEIKIQLFWLCYFNCPYSIFVFSLFLLQKNRTLILTPPLFFFIPQTNKQQKMETDD